MQGPTGEVEINVVDCGTGSFKCSYGTPLPYGQYQLNVSVDNQPIRDLPIEILVNKGANAGSCYAEGPGLDPNQAGSLVDGGAPWFKVYSKDDDGVSVSDAVCAATVKGPNGLVDVTITDEGEGVFLVRYAQPLKAGRYLILPTINGSAVAKAPFKVEVPTLADPDRAVVVGPGLRNGVKMGTGFTKFTILSYDRRGQPVQHHDDLHVSVTGPDGNVVSTSIGQPLSHSDPAVSHEVTYYPVLPGRHQINIRFGEHMIQSSPWDVVVKKGTSRTAHAEMYTSSIALRTE